MESNCRLHAMDTTSQILLVEDNPGDVLIVTHALRESEVTNHLHVG